MVRTPISAAVRGPMVLPQAMSLRTTKAWSGASVSAASFVQDGAGLAVAGIALVGVEV